jgi:hypothetical protein
MWEQTRQALDQSTTRFLTGLATLLPGIVALFVALLVSIVLAWILAAIVRRVLAGMKFDERMARGSFSSLQEWSPNNSPTLLVSQGLAYLVVFTGLLIGIAAFNAELTSLFVRSVFAYIPNVFGALLVLAVGNIAARFVARSVLVQAVNMNFQYALLLSTGVKWLVIVLAVAMALEHLRIAPGIVKLAFGILFGGIVFAMALSVGLGSKELVVKSFERDPKQTPAETMEEPFRHV